MGKNITRRGFVAGTGLAGIAAGLGLAGCAPRGAATQAVASTASGTGGGTNLPAGWDEECDVLVLGGGGAGASAALHAAKAGASVILLDSQSTNSFSATSICYGNFCVVGSDEQKALGIEDSVEQFLEDALANGNSDGNVVQANREDAIRTFAENSARGYRVLKDAGTVLGAIAQKKGKEVAYKAKKAVLMCTGSFLRNVELLEECAMGFSKIPLFTGQGLTGLGHLALMDLGAAMWGRETVYAVEGHSEDGAAFCEMPHFGAIVTDLSGNRFFDDGQYWTNARTRAMVAKAKQEGNERFQTWMIADQAAYDRAVETGPKNGIYEQNESYFVKGDTVEELAAAINAPDLPATIERYNADVANGGDTLFGRTFWNGTGTPSPVPLDQPPYYAYASYPNILYTPTTGFMINGECQVIGQYDDQPVGGGRLFAAGEIVTRSVVGNHYMVGVGIGSCTTLGMVIGEKAAALDSRE